MHDLKRPAESFPRLKTGFAGIVEPESDVTSSRSLQDEDLALAKVLQEQEQMFLRLR